jgi:hypothetical protein
VFVSDFKARWSRSFASLASTGREKKISLEIVAFKGDEEISLANGLDGWRRLKLT